LLLLIGDVWFFVLNPRIWSFGVIWVVIWVFGLGFGSWKDVILWGFGLGGLFLLLRFFAKLYLKIRYNLINIEGIGLGDVFVAFLIGMGIGLILPADGWLLMMVSLVYLVLAAGVGLAYALGNWLFFKGKIGKSIPFLPAMIVAFWILVAMIDKVLSWLV